MKLTDDNVRKIAIEIILDLEPFAAKDDRGGKRFGNVYCPFCGGNAIISYDPDGVQDTAGRKWAWTIVCERCCATSGLTFLKEKAISAWNRRVGDDLMERIVDDGK